MYAHLTGHTVLSPRHVHAKKYKNNAHQPIILSWYTETQTEIKNK